MTGFAWRYRSGPVEGVTVLNPDVLREPHVQACVQALASTLGGQLLYSPGTAAREVLLAAGVRVAAATHRPLVVIDDEAQREDTADFLAALGLDENAAHFLTPDQAFRWLPPNSAPRACWPSTGKRTAPRASSSAVHPATGSLLGRHRSTGSDPPTK